MNISTNLRDFSDDELAKELIKRNGIFMKDNTKKEPESFFQEKIKQINIILNEMKRKGAEKSDFDQIDIPREFDLVTKNGQEITIRKYEMYEMSGYDIFTTSDDYDERIPGFSEIVEDIAHFKSCQDYSGEENELSIMTESPDFEKEDREHLLGKDILDILNCLEDNNVPEILFYID